MKRILVVVLCTIVVVGCSKEKEKILTCSGLFEISTQDAVILQKSEYVFTFDKNGDNLRKMSASITIGDSPMVWAAGEGKDGVNCNKGKEIICEYKIDELDTDMKNEVYRFLGETLTFEEVKNNLERADYICE